MSMMVSFVLSFFPRDVLDEILNLIGSVSEGFPSYSFNVSCIISSSFLISVPFYLRKRQTYKILMPTEFCQNATHILHKI